MTTRIAVAAALVLGTSRIVPWLARGELKELENQGYQFEAAEGSFELLMRRAKGQRRKFFDLIGYRVTVEKLDENSAARAEATIQVSVDGVLEHTAAEGNGPVDALNKALRKALKEATK